MSFFYQSFLNKIFKKLPKLCQKIESLAPHSELCYNGGFFLGLIFCLFCQLLTLFWQIFVGFCYAIIGSWS